MRAILLESNATIAAMLPCACDEAGINLKTVGSLALLERSARHAGLDDVVIVDCSLDRSQDKARCLALARRLVLDLHVIYKPGAPDHTAFRRRLEHTAHGAVWSTRRTAPSGAHGARRRLEHTAHGAVWSTRRTAPSYGCPPRWA